MAAMRVQIRTKERPKTIHSQAQAVRLSVWEKKIVATPMMPQRPGMKPTMMLIQRRLGTTESR